MTYIVEYLRMVSYAIVILTSLRGIVKRKFNSMLFFGDIIMAAVLLSGTLLSKFFGISRDISGTIILTPAVIIWAIIHFINLLKYERN